MKQETGIQIYLEMMLEQKCPSIIENNKPGNIRQLESTIIREAGSQVNIITHEIKAYSETVVSTQITLRLRAGIPIRIIIPESQEQETATWLKMLKQLAPDCDIQYRTLQGSRKIRRLLQTGSMFRVEIEQENGLEDRKLASLNQPDISKQLQQFFQNLWDQLEEPEPQTKPSTMPKKSITGTIRINYHWNKPEGLSEEQFGKHEEALRERAEERIFQQIGEGYNSGELSDHVRMDESDGDDGVAYRGWWESKKE